MTKTRAHCAKPTGDSKNLSLRERLSETNINSETFLATDYLNHFNEVVMILDLVADMPDCLEDIADWAPKTYEDHFAHSGFPHKALAIEAWTKASASRRAALEAVIDDLNLLILCTIAEATTAIAADKPETVRMAVSDATAKLRRLITEAGKIINGGEIRTRSDRDESALNQDAIDSLFD